ncbi:MAG TPA: 4-coumarate--CoA ligase family protein [Acidobacteriota bacterium]|jgi:acyl-CoA synthetase (AMP-forming)/AMP-acid ligase II
MIFRSPYPDVEIPDISLTPFVLQQASVLGEKPALIDEASGRTLTYRQLEREVRSVASSLARRGFNKGDVLALLSPNLPEYAVAFLAVSLLGGVNTTINPLCTAGEIEKQLRDSSAKYLVTTPALLEKAFEAAASRKVQDVFLFGGTTAETATPFGNLLEGNGQIPEVKINPREDVVALPYSSGTTGLPKGVMLTHRNLVANMRQMDAAGHIGPEDTLAGVLPFFHIYGMVVVLNHALYKGATIVCMARFDLDQFLRVLQDYGVTYAHLVPPIVLALANHPDIEKYRLSKLRMIMSGAAPLSPEIAARCAQRLGCAIKQGYGMTETSPVTHLSPEDPHRIKLGSVGPCVSNTECKIVDPATGVELGANQKGEILVRGPQVTKGYLNRPDATAQVIDAQGWLRTGDIGYADEDCFFYIVDRVKELIKYKGLQVAPAELEAVLLSHPSIADAAVIPSLDQEAGEVPKAFLVLKSQASAEEIMQFVASRVAPYKKIRRIEFVEQIPKSPSGKILRRVLVERDRAGIGKK